jgi:hypothetical protein
VIVPSRKGLLSFTGSAQTTSNRIWVFSQEETREKVAKMIILHEYPFSIVEHQGFIVLMRTAQPNFTMPGRKAIRSNCIKLFNSMKAQLMQKTAKAKCILLTTDLWTASNLTGHMVVTAHYITDNWKLLKVIIGFRPLPPPHTGLAIEDCLSQTLIDWKAVNKLAFVTLENVAMTWLQRFLNNCSQALGSATSPYFHVQCLAHVINLVVKDGLQTVGTAVERLRASVHYFHGLSARMDLFEKALAIVHIDINKKHPCKDIPTWWNSTFFDDQILNSMQTSI